jgi:chlorobactene glucosyltransferase
MMLDVYMLVLVLWIFALWMGQHGNQVYIRLPEVLLPSPKDPLPDTSIIIPARNEEHNLPRLLKSLKAQVYEGNMEVVVVNDQSIDQTAHVAQLNGAQVISLNHLPQGWPGKPHACQCGLEATRGEWVLFVDADTAYEPYAIKSVVVHALENHLDELSIFLRQDTNGRFEAGAIAAAFTLLFSGRGVINGMLNGQFILLRRKVFDSIGGFESARDQAWEDLALGRPLFDPGFTVSIARGELLGKVRKYQSVNQMQHGLTRLSSGALNFSQWRWALTVFLCAKITTPIVLLIVSLRYPTLFPITLISWLCSSLLLLSWTSRLKRPFTALAAPFIGSMIVLFGMTGLTQKLPGIGVQ